MGHIFPGLISESSWDLCVYLFAEKNNWIYTEDFVYRTTKYSKNEITT